jgi:hypothetical protein
VSKGLLVEEARTNNILQSQDLTTAWAANRGTISSNTTVAPDGTTTADRFVENTAIGVHGPVQTPVTTSAAAWTASGFFKAGSRSVIVMRFQDYSTGLDGVGAEFNLSTGTISSPAVVVGAFTSPSATISNVGGGWYRCTVTGTANTAQCSFRVEACTTTGGFSAVFFGGSSYTGDGASYFDSWGYQIESGSFSTSYIPTTTAAVTRSADVCQITGGDFSGFYNQSEGSFAVEYDRVGVDNSKDSEAIQVTNSSGSSQYYIDSVGGNEVANFFISPTMQAALALGLVSSAGIYVRAAIAYKINDFAASRNGAAVITDTSGTVPTVDRMGIGRDIAANNFTLNGHIARLRYFNTRLTNSQLVELST